MKRFSRPLIFDVENFSEKFAAVAVLIFKYCNLILTFLSPFSGSHGARFKLGRLRISCFLSIRPGRAGHLLFGASSTVSYPILVTVA